MNSLWALRQAEQTYKSTAERLESIEVARLKPTSRLLNDDKRPALTDGSNHGTQPPRWRLSVELTAELFGDTAQFFTL